MSEIRRQRGARSGERGTGALALDFLRSLLRAPSSPLRAFLLHLGRLLLTLLSQQSADELAVGRVACETRAAVVAHEGGDDVLDEHGQVVAFGHAAGVLGPPPPVAQDVIY